MTNFVAATSATGTTNFQSADVSAADATGGAADTTAVVYSDESGQQYTAQQIAGILKSQRDRGGFIEQLKAETAEYRRLLEQALAQVKEGKTVKDLLSTPPPDNNHTEPVVTQPTYNPDEIAESVLSRITASKQKEQEEKNFQEVSTKLTALYGSRTNEIVQRVASENGMSVAEAAVLARQRPSVFTKLFPELSGVKPQGAASHSPSVNSASFAANAPAPTIGSYHKLKGKALVAKYQELLNAARNEG